MGQAKGDDLEGLPASGPSGFQCQLDQEGSVGPEELSLVRPCGL